MAWTILPRRSIFWTAKRPRSLRTHLATQLPRRSSNTTPIPKDLTPAVRWPTDLNSQTTNFSYDLLGRVIETDFPPDLSGNRGQSTRTFNESSLPLNVTLATKITTSLSVSSNLEVDGLGRVRKTKLLSDLPGV